MKTRTLVRLERLALAGFLTASGASASHAATFCVNPAGTGGVLVFTNTPDATSDNFWRIHSVP